MFRQSILCVAVASLCSLLYLVVFSHSELNWQQRLPEAFGFGEANDRLREDQISSEENVSSDNQSSSRPDHADFKGSTIPDTSPFSVGKTKPPGSNYTRCLVVPRMKSEDTSWIEQELRELLESGLLQTAVYTVDDSTADLRPPKNKGHEVMVYLSYIIDNYERLSDVTMFMHAHRFAWHNNELLEADSAQMVRHLSSERVTREGYMNLRCHWNPGCPEWLHPGATLRDVNKQEEVLLAESWAELFPMDAVPNVLAQPCCAQFAVSRERILQTDKMRYITLRDWVLGTELSDYLSGRVFEYIWQFIFSAAPVHCPSMRSCYCDGYGLCFDTSEAFDRWFELHQDLKKCKEELRVWQEKANLIEQLRTDSKDRKIPEEAEVEVPEVGKDVEFKTRIRALQDDLDQRKRAAFELGRSPEQRALESDREWKAGNGF